MSRFCLSFSYDFGMTGVLHDQSSTGRPVWTSQHLHPIWRPEINHGKLPGQVGLHREVFRRRNIKTLFGSFGEKPSLALTFISLFPSALWSLSVEILLLSRSANHSWRKILYSRIRFAPKSRARPQMETAFRCRPRNTSQPLMFNRNLPSRLLGFYLEMHPIHVTSERRKIKCHSSRDGLSTLHPPTTCTTSGFLFRSRILVREISWTDFTSVRSHDKICIRGAGSRRYGRNLHFTALFCPFVGLCQQRTSTHRRRRPTPAFPSECPASSTT